MSQVEYLRTLPLFAGLAEAELETIARCLGWRAFGRGVYVFHQGGPGRTLYVIKSGKVRCFVADDEGRQITMDILGPGQAFGLLGALDDRPRATGVQVVEQAVVLTLARQDLLPLLDEFPRLRSNLDELLATYLRRTLAYVQDLAFLDVKGRVAVRLLTLADRFGAPGDGVTIAWLPSQQELANWAAATRESVNRVLCALRDEGLIQLEGDMITIPDRHRLEGQIQR
jgi:CRP-like cAMP-binding protein